MELDGENSIFTCSLSGDIEALQGLLECKSSSNVDETLDVFQEKDEFGRNALFVSCMLGRSDIIRELLRYGASVNERTVRGYSPLHYAALWGHLDTVKTLVELGANLHAQNFRGERANEVACRYSKIACAEYLSWAEAKQNLEEYITQARDAFCDEKAQGKLNKEEKNLFMSSCSVKADWIQNAKNPSVQDFTEQKKHLENILSPLLVKLTAPSEATTKTRKH
ncbi:hypothetical protein ANANG_G00126620 [Anguilla anguilla]|uniref:Ankyrin repeat domain 45 n=1 Tax=Anguilla anguilla TaxID=7936 RepID=A0A9D3MGA0_ANGAN|nr:hypothetical protein ANANG_G00126620 [Anguilla anguilla]